MATRFYLSASAVPAASPTISADWNAHVNTLRRSLNSVNAGSTLATTTFTPDAADHLVAGRSHVCQFVTESLPPQTIPAQTVKLQLRAAEAIATNNLFVNWKLYAVSEDGSNVLGTLIAIKADGTEVGTALTNRADTSLTTVFTSAVNFRLVLELGLGGTPTASAGIDGHNGSMSFGESATTDLPEDDAATAALNPWLQFPQNIKLWQPPAPPSGWIRVEIARAQGDPAAPAGWNVSQVFLSTMFPFEGRWRIGRLFQVIAAAIDWDHDDIIVLFTNENLSAALIDRLKEVRNHMLPMQKVCLLENGLRLSDLTPAQIAARVG